jgi:hypothetical protein
MSAVAVVVPRIEGRIWLQSDLEQGDRYLGIPLNGPFTGFHQRLSGVQATGCGTI